MGCDFLNNGYCNHGNYKWKLRRNKVNDAWQCLYKNKKRCPLYNNQKWMKDLVKLLRLLYPKTQFIDKKEWKEWNKEYGWKVLRVVAYWSRGVIIQLMKNNKGQYQIVQHCDGEDEIQIPREWGEALEKLNQPKVKLEWW